MPENCRRVYSKVSKLNIFKLWEFDWFNTIFIVWGFYCRVLQSSVSVCLRLQEGHVKRC